MVAIDKYNFPDELFYNNQYLWARVEGDIVTVGAANFAAIESGEISYVDLMSEIDDEVTAGKPFGSVESGKGATTLYAPVSGTITEVNDDTQADPSLINSDCYGTGWIVKIQASNLAEDLAKLWKPTNPEFQAWQNSEIQKADAKKKELGL